MTKEFQVYFTDPISQEEECLCVEIGFCIPSRDAEDIYWELESLRLAYKEQVKFESLSEEVRALVVKKADKLLEKHAGELIQDHAAIEADAAYDRWVDMQADAAEESKS